MTAPPAIDLAHLGIYTQGDAALERELFQLFGGSARSYVDAMRRAEDHEAWRQAAHGLKGAARSIGAFGVADLAERAEEADEPVGSDEAAGYLSDLEAALDQVDRFIAAHLET